MTRLVTVHVGFARKDGSIGFRKVRRRPGPFDRLVAAHRRVMNRIDKPAGPVEVLNWGCVQGPDGFLTKIASDDLFPEHGYGYLLTEPPRKRGSRRHSNFLLDHCHEEIGGP